jgi:hypothetical protein
MLSEDDLNLRELSETELDAAWDLWFDLMQETNDFDPPFTHGVFAYLTWEELGVPPPAARRGPSPRDSASAGDAVRRQAMSRGSGGGLKP